MVKQITNLRTEDTEAKVESNWIEVDAKKHSLLKDTDWTQLADSEVSNREDVSNWRRTLRSLNLRSEFSDPDQAMEFLHEYKKRIPKIKYFEPDTHEAKPPKEFLVAIDNVHIPTITLDEARDLAKSIILLHIHVPTLYQTGFFKYPVMVEKVSQAVEFLADDSADPNQFPLLTTEGESENIRDISLNILQEWKEFISNTQDITNKANELISSVDVMSGEELNRLFEEFGYGHRC